MDTLLIASFADTLLNRPLCLHSFLNIVVLMFKKFIRQISSQSDRDGVPIDLFMKNFEVKNNIQQQKYNG